VCWSTCRTPTTLGPDAIADENGCQEVHGNPKQIDWSNRTIRYVPARAGRAARDEFEDLYAAIWARAQRYETLGHLTVLLDESYGPTEANWSPTYLTTALTQGRKKQPSAHGRDAAAGEGLPGDPRDRRSPLRVPDGLAPRRP